MTHNFVASYNWAIPFDRAFSGATEAPDAGLEHHRITRFSTGFPISISRATGIIADRQQSTDEPNLVGPVVTQDPRKPGPNGAEYLFPAGRFHLRTPLGHFGNANRRFFHGPGIVNTDFGDVEENPDHRIHGH